MLLVLHTIDARTQCWLEEKQIMLSDLAELQDMLNLEQIELNLGYELGPGELQRLEQRYQFAFASGGLVVEMTVFERKSPFPEGRHTGRELLLMLAGKKPLAAFVEEHPLRTSESFIPEAYFDPYVDAKRFLKRVEIHKTACIGTLRRVLYAIPSQEWRIDSYLVLWNLCDKYGWNDGLEKSEGYLLGYDPDIDPFFAEGNRSR